MPALPPERQSKKNDFSSSFEHRHPAGDGTSANIPPMDAAVVSADKRLERREGLTNWTPWVTGACLAGGALLFLRNLQTRSPASVAAAPVDSAPKQPAPGPKQLKTRDPFYMERATMTTPATDGKMIVNALYHSAVVSGLATGYARLGKMARLYCLDLFEAVRTSNPSMCFYILVKAFQMNAHDINIKKSEYISHKHR